MQLQETMGQLKLFDEDDNDDVSKIEINKEYAKRLEHNKKREELQRYEEMKKKGLIKESDEESEDESSESDEDNNDIIGNSKKDLDFIKALLLIKKQDPSLKEKDVKLFDSESDGSEGEGETEESEKMGKKKRETNKAMYLKDVMARHLIEEGPEFQEENEEDLGEKKKKQSYYEEQEEIRKAFLDAVNEAEGNEEEEDGFLKEKNKGDDGEDVEDDDNDEFVKKLDEYFGGAGELDENKMFLKDFFKNKMWIDKEDNNKNVDIDEEVEDLLKEDEELERQELYETTFRHEEEVEDRVMGHSRKVEGSVRKKENARKEQRKSKEERMKIAEMERKEELKHLKNLKKKEMKERMKKVMAIAGFEEEEDLPMSLKDLDDEFDPEEYDRMMKAVFDAKYYDAEDVNPQFGQDREEDEGDIEKPDFDKEDELLGLPKGWDVIESGDGFKAARERSLKHKLEKAVNDDDSEGESEGGGNDDNDEAESERGEEQGEVFEESKRKKKRKMSLVKKAKEEMLEEFYKLDYEDTIGDLKTRFKYAKVKPNRYGLKTGEILTMNDKDLNQYVSVKKLAPYREKEWKVPDIKRYQLKLQNKDAIHGQKSDDWKVGKKKRLKVDAETTASEVVAKRNEKAHQEGPNGDVGNLSKRAKTRRRQAKLKLSHSRLIAYGKITSKPKSKH